MEIKDKLEKIGELIKGFFSADPAPAPAPTPAPVAMAKDYTLQDGTTCSIDKLEVGGAVTVAGAPAPDGTHTLQDGTAITTAGGLITAVTPAAPQEMTTPAQMKAALDKFASDSTAAPDMAKLVTILKACFEYNFGWQIREEQEKLQRAAAIEAYKTGFTAQESTIKKMAETIQLQQEVIEAFGKKSATPAKELPENFESLTPLQQRRALRSVQN